MAEPAASEPVDLRSGDWLDANRRSWDEVVPIHLASDFYDQTELRAGRGRLLPLEEAELDSFIPGGWAGKRVLHLQCHFGADTLAIAQKGADVVGVDFSKPAVAAARALAAEIGLSDRARFIHANVYDARHILPEPESFDVVYITWGTIGWLPDVAEWARIIAWFLKPGGRLYFADGHPAALVFDEKRESTGMPQFTYAYDNDGQADVIDEDGDYADRTVKLENTVTHEWSHPVGETLTALLDAGLRLEFFHEHYGVPWEMFGMLERGDDGLWSWPDKKWLPLSLSLGAVRD